RLQQTIEAAGGRAALGQEERGTVEITHVADPIGLEDRLAARDRQCVEGADRTLRIFLQVVEERSLISTLHAFQNGKVQFQQLLDRIEDTAYSGGLRAAGDILDPTVDHEIEIEFRPHSLQNLREI